MLIKEPLADVLERVVQAVHLDRHLLGVATFCVTEDVSLFDLDHAHCFLKVHFLLRGKFLSAVVEEAALRQHTQIEHNGRHAVLALILLQYFTIFKHAVEEYLFVFLATFVGGRGSDVKRITVESNQLVVGLQD